MMRFLWTLAWRSAWNRRFTLALTDGVDRAVHLHAAGHRTHPHRHPRQLHVGRVRHRPDRRCAHRLGAAAAVCGVPCRRGHQQHPLEHGAGACSNSGACDWIIPLSLGDSHRGIPGAGHRRATTSRTFAMVTTRRCSWRRATPCPTCSTPCSAPKWPARLGYRLGDRIVLSHGSGALELSQHADKPFVVTRHPGADRHAGGPHRAHQPAGHGGPARGLVCRRAAAGPAVDAATGAPDAT